MLHGLARTYEEVAAQLPFAVDDYEAANRLYARWRAHGRPEDHDLLLTWLFCYTHRYFLIKWMQQRQLGAAEIEEPLSLALRRCQSHLDRVAQPERFAHYMSRVCKNTFINFCRRRQRHPSAAGAPLAIDQERAEERDPLEEHDRRILLDAVHRALERLPESLRTVARMRVIEGLPYDEIARRSGHSRPNVRSYYAKALAKLRRDPRIRALIDERSD